jgi:hypothetical protein
MEERHTFEPSVQDAQHCVFCGGELYAKVGEAARVSRDSDTGTARSGGA